MYLLDTVAISELEKARPSEPVIQFLLSLPVESTHLSVITIGEIRKGISAVADENRKARLLLFLQHQIEGFGDRVLPITAEVAQVWGDLEWSINGRRGRQVLSPDLLIAATALHHDLTVITRNISDFEPTGCKIHNPWHQVS